MGKTNYKPIGTFAHHFDGFLRWAENGETEKLEALAKGLKKPSL